MDRCRFFVEDPAPDVQLSIGAYTLIKLKRCFSVFKAMVLDGRQAPGDGGGGGGSNGEIQLQRRKFKGQQENPGEGVTKPETEIKGELGGQVRRAHNSYGEATFACQDCKWVGILRTWDEDCFVEPSVSYGT